MCHRRNDLGDGLVTRSRIPFYFLMVLLCDTRTLSAKMRNVSERQNIFTKST